MLKNDINIYQTARLAAGHTQERAAELLGIGVRSLAAYETGERIPADDVIVRMTDVYNTQFLAYQHLRNNLEAARSILPEVTPQSLTMSILRLQKEVKDFLDVRDEMIEITCDGVIDESERERWEACMKEANDVCRSIMALQFAKCEEVAG